MKVSQDPRHQNRIDLMKGLFGYSFSSDQDLNPALAPIAANLPHIDALIQSAAPEWPIDQINRVDLATLRLAVHELLEKKQPYKVVIDEAVEIAKEYGSENSAKFVNGVLGTIVPKI
jgi:transcription antitermination protein NusB